MTNLSQYAHHMLSMYGYFGLFFIMMLEGLGCPLPIQIVFVAAVVFIHKNLMSTLCVVIFAALGNLCGNIIAYYIGYYGGKPLFDRTHKFLKITYEDIEKYKIWFNKYGSVTNMISRWIGITRTPSIWAAGLLRINIYSYIIFSFIGDLVWTIFWIALFTRVRSNIYRLLSLPTEYKILGLCAIIAIMGIIWWYFFKVFKRKSV